MNQDKKEVFLYYWKMLAPHAEQPQAEYPFTKTIGRRHRFDFAFPVKKIAVEIEGNAWHTPGGGRHMQDSDLEKYNLAASFGWRVFRFSPGMLKNKPAQCIEIVLRALESE